MFILTVILTGLYLQESFSCIVNLTGSSVVTAGSSYLYTCKLYSCEDCSHRWLVGDDIITNNVQNNSCSETTGAENETLFNSVTTLSFKWIRPVDSSGNQQNINCQQTSVNISSTSLAVNIQYGPALVNIDDNAGRGYNYTLKEGDDTPSISCRASCNPSCNLHFLDAQSQTYSNPLRIRNISKEKMGYYTCRAKNSIGEKNSSSSVYLNVQYKPVVSVIISPSGLLDEGTTVIMKCTASGNPEIEMDLMEHYSGDSKIRTLQSYYQENNIMMYRLPNVSYQDSGHYKCVVSNNISTTSVDSNLEVKTKPLILVKTKVIKDFNNGTTEISVDLMSAGDTPVVRWFKLPNVVISENHPTLIQSLNKNSNRITKYNVSVHTESYRCKLLIMNKTSVDDGIYIAYIRNTLGEQVVQFEIGDNSGPVSPGQGNALTIVGGVLLAFALVLVTLSVVLFILYKRREQQRRKHECLSNSLPSADELNLQRIDGSSRSNIIGDELSDVQDTGYISVLSPDITLGSISGDDETTRQYQNEQFPCKSPGEESQENVVNQREHKDPKYANVKKKDSFASHYVNVKTSDSGSGHKVIIE